MGYRNLSHCLRDLEANRELIRIEDPVDPRIEAGVIQRRVFQAGGPALLFTRVKGSPFPMAANIFGTKARLQRIFRDTIPSLEALVKLKTDPLELLRRPLLAPRLPAMLWRTRPKRVDAGPVTQGRTSISSLPQLVSWPGDGGAYATLPQVYSEDPDRPGFRSSNLGMYRIQLSGNDYAPDSQVGLHYQIHRGIGHHHARALARHKPLPVNVFIGGPPAMTLAAVMPLPEGMPEVSFAGMLGGHRIAVARTDNGLPVPVEADFCISGHVYPEHLLPEGPFGDHLGYYSLAHDFPVLTVDAVLHRKDAVWPFTTVGRPPQEDSVLGEFIHELTGPLVPQVFQGVHEVNAVDQAGVHPLLLAIGSERYVPFSSQRMPQELMTNAHALLGNTQTSLSKYVLIVAREDDPRLSARHIPDFFAHLLKRVDWSRDLHFITRTTMDTLDYSGISLNQGSKVIIAAAGEPRRSLGTSLPRLDWPEGLSEPRILAPGILILQSPPHDRPRDTADPELEKVCSRLSGHQGLEAFPLLVVVDDSDFTARSWDNFLWVTFTRSDPATDIYGPNSFIHCKHWGCQPTLVVDARLKTYHASPLEPDPEVEKRVDRLGAPGGPLHGMI
jgi:4-hydroxy-3-polyprenylbenzoate decarboxylase